MARIRSIKPEFFTSETLARVTISARLTFVGLWTYVDDNGVGHDNERLIMAALFPLDDDLIGTLTRLREDLRSLSEQGVIVRYEADGRRYLYVNAWTEHQKVSHPRASRYPLPTSENVNSGKAPEDFPSAPEVVRPEQGAGSRELEQGAGENGSSPAVPHQGLKAVGKKRKGVFVGGEWINTPVMCPIHQDYELSDIGTCIGCEADRKAEIA